MWEGRWKISLEKRTKNYIMNLRSLRTTLTEGGGEEMVKILQYFRIGGTTYGFPRALPVSCRC